nr:MAG TPA: hypothetical protein [Caudoviricetes sp.]
MRTLSRTSSARVSDWTAPHLKARNPNPNPRPRLRLRPLRSNPD